MPSYILKKLQCYVANKYLQYSTNTFFNLAQAGTGFDCDSLILNMTLALEYQEAQICIHIALHTFILQHPHLDYVANTLL